MKKVILLLGILSSPYFIFAQEDYCSCTDSEPSAFLFMVKEITKTLPPQVNETVNPFTYNDDWNEEPQFFETPEFEVQNTVAQPWTIEPIEQLNRPFQHNSSERLKVYSNKTAFEEIESKILTETEEKDKNDRALLAAERLPTSTTEFHTTVEILIEIEDTFEEEPKGEITQEAILSGESQSFVHQAETIVENKAKSPTEFQTSKEEKSLEDKQIASKSPTPPPIDFLDPADDPIGVAAPTRESRERGSNYSSSRIKQKKKVKRIRLRTPKRTGRYKGKCPMF